MTRRTRSHGGTSLEMLICLPFVVVCIQGMILLYTANVSRHRTHAALPEVGRRIAQREDGRSSFRLTDDSRTTVEGSSAGRSHSLDGSEMSLCRQAQYSPPAELERVRFRLNTEHVGIEVPGATNRITTRAPYSETYLSRR